MLLCENTTVNSLVVIVYAGDDDRKNNSEGMQRRLDLIPTKYRIGMRNTEWLWGSCNNSFNYDYLMKNPTLYLWKH